MSRQFASFVIHALEGFLLMANSQCSDVLKDGTRAVSLYSSRFEYRRLLDSRLVNMTFQEAKSDTSLTGTIPIGDIVLGIGFDQKTFDSYKNYLQQDVSLRVDVNRSLDIMLSTGDPEILKAWSSCMKDTAGLSLVFSEIHSKTAVLTFQWWAAAGVGEVHVTQDFKLPEGVKVVSGGDILSGKQAIVANTPVRVQFELPDATTTFAPTFNVADKHDGLAGSDTAYLPARLETFRESRPYVFPNPAGPTQAVTALHHTGTSHSQTYASDIANGWRFVRSSLVVNATVAIPGQIPGTFANSQALWSGDSQVTVVLGCSNSSGTDIQCQCTNAIEEERWRWRSRVD
jgi:hypothetical protein